MTIEQVLDRIREHLHLDAETEYELLLEIRTHLEEAVADAEAEGRCREDALAEVALRFGVEEVGQALQSTHVGWGTADGVIAAALPVICTLLLRWLVFAPNGTAVGWEKVLKQPLFWVVALASLFLPLFRFRRWRFALVSWTIFWALSVLFVTFPSLHW